jgi:hypothetical protein
MVASTASDHLLLELILSSHLFYLLYLAIPSIVCI